MTKVRVIKHYDDYEDPVTIAIFETTLSADKAKKKIDSLWYRFYDCPGELPECDSDFQDFVVRRCPKTFKATEDDFVDIHIEDF
jgi:hypothetical protein